MNKRVLMSVLAIAITLVLVGGATFTYFQDTETSTGNTFTAGTLDLKMQGGTQPWGDGITEAQWTMSDMAPGSPTTEWGKVSLKNVGSIAAHHVQIGCSYTVTEGAPFGDPDNVDTSLDPDSFAKYMVITEIKYYNTGWAIAITEGGYSVSGTLPAGYPIAAADWQITNSDGVSGISLYDLKYDPLDNLPPPPANGLGVYDFEMAVKFHQDAGNDLQGDTFNLTVIFTLNQDSSQ